MQFDSPVFGLTFEGVVSPDAIIYSSVWLTNSTPYSEKWNVEINIAKDNDIILFNIGEMVGQANSMVEAMIDVSSYCLKHIAYDILDRVKIAGEIDQLTRDNTIPFKKR